jgi:hypothetical protein
MRSRQGAVRAARLVGVAALWLAAGWLAGPGQSAAAGVLSGPAASWPAALSARLPGTLPLRLAAVQPAPLVTDSGMSLRTKAGLPAPAMSATMLAANAEKQAAARQFVASARNGALARGCTGRACRNGFPSARDLRPTQRAQITDYFCGPATVAEMLAQMGKIVGQSKSARELGTTPGGTDWSDAGGYPVPNVLNRNQDLNVYVAVGLPWVPTAAQAAAYETDLVTDINHNGGVPLAGDAYEVPGGPHLAGHPANQTIYHWFDIRGYRNSGAITDYEDSVHGASSIGWAATVPAYSSLPSVTIVDIVGARGYDW